MKKITTLFLFIIYFGGFSQHKVAEKILEINNSNAKYQHFSIFNVSINPNNLNEVVEKATFSNLQLSENNIIVANQPEFLELEIPYNNQIIEIQLYKVDIFAENFHIDSDISKNIAYQKGVYYRGIIKDDYTSVVSFNFFKDECNGIISSHLYDNLVVGKLIDRKSVV